jgi:hypothetical protein
MFGSVDLSDHSLRAVSFLLVSSVCIDVDVRPSLFVCVIISIDPMESIEMLSGKSTTISSQVNEQICLTQMISVLSSMQIFPVATNYS